MPDQSSQSFFQVLWLTEHYGFNRLDCVPQSKGMNTLHLFRIKVYKCGLWLTDLEKEALAGHVPACLPTGRHLNAEKLKIERPRNRSGERCY